MLTRNTRRASRLTLALGGLLITATVSAADAQNQAQEILIGHGTGPVTVSKATPAISASTSRVRFDAQQQAANLLGGLPQATGKTQSTRIALGTPRAARAAHQRSSNGQEMAQKVVLGISDE